MDGETTQTVIELEQIPCTRLKGVGPRLAEQLAKKSIHSIQDLLFHLPFRYQDRTRITPLRDCRVGDYAVIEAQVQSTKIIPGKRSQFICRLSDGSGKMDLRFFHFSAHQGQSFVLGRSIRCFGEIRLGRDAINMIHPEYQFVQGDEIVEVEEYLTPIYPSTEGLTQRSLRQLTDQALEWLRRGAVLTELLPEPLLAPHGFTSLAEAIAYVHRPPPDANQEALEAVSHPAQLRLVFEELLAQQLSMRRIRGKLRRHKAPKMADKGHLREQFCQQLPFDMTQAQKRVVQEILQDLNTHKPMLRLVQGDVGSGKTVVAAMALLAVVENGYQGALMVPTEILSEQHFANFQKWLEPIGVKVSLLSGKQKAKEKRDAIENIKLGITQIIVGTHALFQKDVEFAKLGLIIVDEQHRFGVHQRMALRDKGIHEGLHPHQLTMTATPIPRSLAMTVYADLDASIIDELPPGRTPVETVALSNDRRDSIIQRVLSSCKQGHQAYWVCTLIEESEVLTCQAAQEQADALALLLPELTIGLVHGRMHPQDKEAVMEAFKKGDIDLLVATTVIEVGVDVPNANLMIIENAERLGLAQLHQLRGRVGRGSLKSFCVLLYQAPLSDNGYQRLGIMRETSDGFKVAQKDLELRGPGEVLGTRQTGLIQFRIADIIRDKAMLPHVKQAARDIEKSHPHLSDQLINRWLPNREQYGGV